MTRRRTFYLVVLLLALVLAGVASGFASSSPDGLEKVAQDQGFSGTARDHELSGSPVADYGVQGVANARLSGGLAGVIGVGVTLALGTGVFLVLRRRAAPPAPPAPPAAADPARVPDAPPPSGTDD